MDDDRGALARLNAALELRFDCAPFAVGEIDVSGLVPMAEHRSQRAFSDDPVPAELLRLLCAIALSSPTKSDLQQRDIVVVRDPAQRARLDGLVAGQPWVRRAPVLLVFCGNNRRQRQLHEWHGVAFANDHLDAFFNAAVDAAIALSAFVLAAETAGLGCCPISALRNDAAAVSAALELPPLVFPVAGLGVGWPSGARQLHPRLPLEATLHIDRFDESGIRERVAAYDARRAQIDPYAKQREPRSSDEPYGWSEDRVLQYAVPERADFGTYIREIGFNLD